jgi:hypothetical protein
VGEAGHAYNAGGGEIQPGAPETRRVHENHFINTQTTLLLPGLNVIKFHGRKTLSICRSRDLGARSGQLIFL